MQLYFITLLLLYNIGIFFYWVLVHLLAPFHKKAGKWVKGRRGIWERLGNLDARPCAWFHCASLGEFEQARPVLEAYRKRYPTHSIVLTFFSPSGYDVRKNYPLADWVGYLPIDTASNARRFIKAVKPQVVFFVKYEFWYHYLKQAHQSGALVISFSTIFRPSQPFFKSYGTLHRKMLGFFDHIFVQNKSSLELLSQIHYTKATLTGDTRYDRVLEIAAQAKDNEVVSTFKGEESLLILGSAWLADLNVWTPILNDIHFKPKVLIAPHEIGETVLSEIEALMGKASIRYSQYKKGTEARILIVDNIGMLSSLYRYGTWTYVGGAFGKGLHNILEAAVFGMPILFGPRYQKFDEAIQMIEKGGAFSVSDTEALKQVWSSLEVGSEKYLHSSRAAQTMVQAGQGATGVIMNYVAKEVQQ